MHPQSILQSNIRSLAQLDELDALTTCPPASYTTGGSKVRARLRGASHWASKFDVVSVLGGEGEDGRGSGLGTYGQSVQVHLLGADDVPS